MYYVEGFYVYLIKLLLVYYCNNTPDKKDKKEKKNTSDNSHTSEYILIITL